MIGRIATHVIVAFLVLIWVVPFFGLAITSLRDTKQANETGFWRGLVDTEIGYRFKTRGKEDLQSLPGGGYLITGNVFEEYNARAAQLAQKAGEPEPFELSGRIVAFGPSASKPRAAAVSGMVEVRGGELSVATNGDYQWRFDEPYKKKGKTIGVIVDVPPTFGIRNYLRTLKNGKISQALVNSFVVTVPATIIPITVAAFAAYAFAWMSFPGRNAVFIVVISLMIVPLQLAFIPVLTLYADTAGWITALRQVWGDCTGNDCEVSAKSFAGLWAAHTAFGLPLAIFILHKYVAGLPREIMESARVDGASHFTIFVKIVVPLAIPAFTAFAIMQFLWVWNDLLVALILGPSSDLVLPIVIQKQIGTYKSELELLNASALISMIVPLMVFIALQRFFVRGLLAGSVKGG